MPSLPTQSGVKVISYARLEAQVFTLDDFVTAFLFQIEASECENNHLMRAT